MIFLPFVSGMISKEKNISGKVSIVSYGETYLPLWVLKNDSLMELFTAKGSQASSDAGTVISQLSDFRFSEMENGFYHFSLERTTGVCSEFLLHRTGKKEAS